VWLLIKRDESLSPTTIFFGFGELYSFLVLVWFGLVWFGLVFEILVFTKVNFHQFSSK
jgi:hypothetical protein